MKKNGPEAKLLVVDDEPNIRELLSTSLRFAGFEVVSAGSGREALAAAELHSPDLAVLDVMLPDMDGFTVTPACAPPANTSRFYSSRPKTTQRTRSRA